MQYLGIASLLIVLASAARWLQLAWRVNIPRNPTQFQLLWAGGLALGVVALYLDASTTFAAWGIGLGIVMLYLSFTGGQRTEGDTVDEGDALPAFTSADETGAPFDSASLQGSRVLLKFFRGHW